MGSHRREVGKDPGEPQVELCGVLGGAVVGQLPSRVPEVSSHASTPGRGGQSELLVSLPPFSVPAEEGAVE